MRPAAGPMAGLAGMVCVVAGSAARMRVAARGAERVLALGQCGATEQRSV